MSVSPGGPVDDNLEELARVYRVSPRFAHVEAMLRCGLDSASAGAAMAEADFVERHAAQRGGED